MAYGIRVGIVGWGYWGPKVARALQLAEVADGSRLLGVCDSDLARRGLALRYDDRLRVTADLDELLSWVDAVVITTPVSTHYRLAKAALLARKHVLVAKPLAATVAECRALMDEAHRSSFTLMVDHTFLYTDAVRQLRSLVDSGALGDLLYVESTRQNLGLYQKDCNVLWDLAPHDLSILLALTAEDPVEVSALAEKRGGLGHADLAWLHLRFPSGLAAHIGVSWLSPVKVRRTVVAGAKAMVVYDDMEPSEKIRVYDVGVTVENRDTAHAALADYRTGDITVPHLDPAEALVTELSVFLGCIRGGGYPPTGAAQAIRVVRVLEAAAESIETGRRVRL